MRKSSGRSPERLAEFYAKKSGSVDSVREARFIKDCRSYIPDLVHGKGRADHGGRSRLQSESDRTDLLAAVRSAAWSPSRGLSGSIRNDPGDLCRRPPWETPRPMAMGIFIT